MDDLHVGESRGTRVCNRVPLAFEPVCLVHKVASRSSGSTGVSLCHGMLEDDQVILGRYHVLIAQPNVRNRSTADITSPNYDQWILSARFWFFLADRALDRAFASEVRAPEKASRSDTQGPTVSASTQRSCGSSVLIVMSRTSCRSTRTLNVPTSPSISSGRADGCHRASIRQWWPSKLHDAQGAVASSSPSMSVTPFGAVHFSPRTLDFAAQSCAIFNNSGTAALSRASVTHRAALTAFASASLLRSTSATLARSRAPSSR